MVNLYAKRILAGMMALDDVPLLWRNAVEEKLAELNVNPMQ